MNRLSPNCWAVLVLVVAVSVCETARVHALAADPSSPIAEAINRADAGIAAILAVPENGRTYENTVLALDDVLARFDTDCGMTLFMQYVSTDKAERERSSLAEQHYNNWLIDLSKNEAVYAAMKNASGQNETRQDAGDCVSARGSHAARLSQGRHGIARRPAR